MIIHHRSQEIKEVGHFYCQSLPSNLIKQLSVQKNGAHAVMILAICSTMGEAYRIRKDYFVENYDISAKAFTNAMQLLHTHKLAWLGRSTPNADGTHVGQQWVVSTLPWHLLKKFKDYTVAMLRKLGIYNAEVFPKATGDKAISPTPPITDPTAKGGGIITDQFLITDQDRSVTDVLRDAKFSDVVKGLMPIMSERVKQYKSDYQLPMPKADAFIAMPIADGMYNLALQFIPEAEVLVRWQAFLLAQSRRLVVAPTMSELNTSWRTWLNKARSLKTLNTSHPIEVSEDVHNCIGQSFEYLWGKYPNTRRSQQEQCYKDYRHVAQHLTIEAIENLAGIINKDINNRIATLDDVKFMPMTTNYFKNKRWEDG